MKRKENIKKSDLKEWEKYTKNPKDIYDKESRRVNNNSKPTRYKFDLHGFTLAEANNKVFEIINLCVQKKYSEILLVTGKGIHSNTENNVYVSKKLSKLRHSIPDYINSTSEISHKVFSICKAEMKDGGDGALIIKLKL